MCDHEQQQWRTECASFRTSDPTDYGMRVVKLVGADATHGCVVVDIENRAERQSAIGGNGSAHPRAVAIPGEPCARQPISRARQAPVRWSDSLRSPSLPRPMQDWAASKPPSAETTKTLQEPPAKVLIPGPRFRESARSCRLEVVSVAHLDDHSRRDVRPGFVENNNTLNSRHWNLATSACATDR